MTKRFLAHVIEFDEMHGLAETSEREDWIGPKLETVELYPDCDFLGLPITKVGDGNTMVAFCPIRPDRAAPTSLPTVEDLLADIASGGQFGAGADAGRKVAPALMLLEIPDDRITRWENDPDQCRLLPFSVGTNWQVQGLRYLARIIEEDGEDESHAETAEYIRQVADNLNPNDSQE